MKHFVVKKNNTNSVNIRRVSLPLWKLQKIQNKITTCSLRKPNGKTIKISIKERQHQQNGHNNNKIRIFSCEARHREDVLSYIYTPSFRRAGGAIKNKLFIVVSADLSNDLISFSRAFHNREKMKYFKFRNDYFHIYTRERVFAKFEPQCKRNLRFSQ